MKLQNDEPLLKFAFKFNLRRYNLDVLKWARERDCPWDEGTCEAAAEGGHLEVLRWARELDCPWRPQECRRKAAGNQDMLTCIQQLAG